jgi:hypothetical protein
MFKNYIILLLLFVSYSAVGQKLKVEWTSGEVTVTKKSGTEAVALKKNQTIELTDRVFLGEKALLVVSDYSKKLFEVKKKGYVTGKELSEGLLKTADNEYQRYMTYILKELKNHEAKMSDRDKGIPGAPSRGEEFSFTLPDTILFFNNEQLPLHWTNSVNTEMVSIKILNDKKSSLLDLDVNGSVFWINNISTYFAGNKTLHLYVYENRSDGKKELKGHTVAKKSDLKEADVRKDIDKEFNNFQDQRLNLIAKATKWEINFYYLEALNIYKILLLDYPEDEMVKGMYEQFTERNGLR